MSMIAANIEQILTQDKDVPKATPRRYKARMATKVKWAIGDAMNSNWDAQRRIKRMLGDLEELQVIADASKDVNLLSLLGKVNHEAARIASELAEQERILVAADAEGQAASAEEVFGAMSYAPEWWVLLAVLSWAALLVIVTAIWARREW